MPSAVRQNLSIDLWLCQSHRKYFNGNTGPVFHTQNIQASPCDSSQKDKKQKYQGNKRDVCKAQRNHSRNQRNSKTIPRRDYDNTLTTGLSNSERNSSGGRRKKSVLPDQAKPDSYMNVSPDLCSESYAVDSFVAPDPSQLPLPPLEWLQFQLVFPVDNHTTLQSILCCPIAA